MKAISILGTSSNAGKSWVATALCAWLKRQGAQVAPFKAQNMANNAYATLEGGEIGVAQAVQAEACGLRPVAEMNPILLKPSGRSVSQIVRLGKAGEHREARSYYEINDEAWSIVRETLDGWRDKCDVLVMEGAGSPVELNLMHRDIVNLRPVEHTDGRWLLVSSIEQGGVFAQVCGTWGLLPEAAQKRGLGFIVNRFRGDVSLFSEAGRYFAERITLPYLGTLALDESLRIDDEDSMNAVSSRLDPNIPYFAWVKYPQLSISQDRLPWEMDAGIQSIWTSDKSVLRGAAAIVLPGSKNTLLDLRWLKEKGLADVVIDRARNGVPVVGLCGGFQMLGVELFDPEENDREKGLGLLPVETRFAAGKMVTRRRSVWQEEEWETFEIHTGVTRVIEGNESTESLLHWKREDGSKVPEGVCRGTVLGSYQHGLFESGSMRRRLVSLAGVGGVSVCRKSWRAQREEIYERMADALEESVDLSGVRRYLGL